MQVYLTFASTEQWPSNQSKIIKTGLPRPSSSHCIQPNGVLKFANNRNTAPITSSSSLLSTVLSKNQTICKFSIDSILKFRILIFEQTRWMQVGIPASNDQTFARLLCILSKF
uniref:Uncharacterized protein n=1 Tax=Onchocerca volvulus TaxID=6282 RepID=A0A8R1XVU9_ONCVO